MKTGFLPSSFSGVGLPAGDTLYFHFSRFLQDAAKRFSHDSLPIHSAAALQTFRSRRKARDIIIIKYKRIIESMSVHTSFGQYY